MVSEKQIGAWPLYGYAPGLYSAKCSQCGKIYQGEKRSFNCLECAVIQVKQALATAEQAEPAPAARSGAVKVVEDTYKRYPKIMDRLSTLEQAEPARDAEPVATVYRKGNVIGQLVWTKAGDNADLPDGTKLYTHPPECRLREALEKIASSDYIDNALDPERNKRLARAALAREYGR